LQHEVLRNLAVVEALGGTVEDDALEIRLSDQDRQAASRRLRGSRPASKLIALGIGAQAASRRWPLERYAQALSLLERHFQVQPVILCSQEEQEPAAELAKILHVEPILLAGAPLREVCAVLARCELFLGNDSGPAHLAAAMDCSTIVVSRHPRDGDPNHPNSPHRFAPHGRNCCVLQPDQGLGLCHESCQAPEAHCIKAVAVADVVTAALQFVSPETGSRPAVGHHVGWPVLVAPINNHQFQGTLAAR
jgi:heptosyltransferase-2